MAILMSLVIFVAVLIVTAFIGMRLWVRPKVAIERVTGSGSELAFKIPNHPSLVLHDLVRKLGAVLPASPADVTVMRRRLIRAGIKGDSALSILYGSKVLLGTVFPLGMAMLVAGSAADSSNKMLAIGAAAVAGFWGPNEYIKIKAQRRQKEIQRGLANALDLLVVCVESGLGLDQAIVQVAKELAHAHREISEEFAFVNLELKAGKRRLDALRNLGERTSVDDLRKLVAVLIQADRFGTGIGQSLRAHADFMRIQARQVAEEKAAKLGVKLVFPIFFCILPSLFVVTVGPMAVKIVRELLPLMNGV